MVLNMIYLKEWHPRTHGIEGYNYPDEIPTNTVCMTHFVEWYKLPGNLNED